MPFNTFDRVWPRLAGGGEQVPVGSEGWVFPQRFEEPEQYVSLLDANEAIVGSLSQLGIKAELSEPGHIARQMLEQLGGLWGVHLLADIDTLKLLNKMAGGLRRKRNNSETVEEQFQLRTAPLKDWTKLVAARRAKRRFPKRRWMILLSAMLSGSDLRPNARIARPKTGVRSQTLTIA